MQALTPTKAALTASIPPQIRQVVRRLLQLMTNTTPLKTPRELPIVTTMMGLSPACCCAALRKSYLVVSLIVSLSLSVYPFHLLVVSRYSHRRGSSMRSSTIFRSHHAPPAGTSHTQKLKSIFAFEFLHLHKPYAPSPHNKANLCCITL